MTPRFDEYNLEELRESYASLDKESWPEREEVLRKLIKKNELEETQVKEKHSHIKKSDLKPDWFVTLMLGIYLAMSFWNGEAGYTRGSRKVNYTFEDQPLGFIFLVLIFLALLIFQIKLHFKSKKPR